MMDDMSDRGWFVVGMGATWYGMSVAVLFAGSIVEGWWE